MNVTLVSSAAATLTLLGPAFAGPLDPGQVSSRATWVVHLDVEALTSSSLGRHALEHINVNADDESDEIMRRLAFDPREDVFSVTAYGSTEDPEKGVIVFETSGAADGILGRVAEVAEGEVVVHQLRDGPYAISEVGMIDSDEKLFLYFNEVGRDRWRMYGSHSKGLLNHAIEVASGRQASLENSDSPVASLRHRSGTFVVAAATEPEHLNDYAPASQLFKKAEQIFIQLGEDGDDIFAEAKVTVRDENDARSVSQILLGASSLVQMIAASNEDAAEFAQVLQHLHVTSKDRTINVSIELPLELIEEHLGALDGAVNYSGKSENSGGAKEPRESGWWNRE